MKGCEKVASDAILPAVASLSLGGGVSAAMDAAITTMVKNGVTSVVAAGNSNADACLSSPAREEMVRCFFMCIHIDKTINTCEVLSYKYNKVVLIKDDTGNTRVNKYEVPSTLFQRWSSVWCPLLFVRSSELI